MILKDAVKAQSGLELLELLRRKKKQLIADKKILDKKDSNLHPLKDVPFAIPRNWVWCYLSDVSIIQEGPGIRKHQYSDKGIQFLTVTNILEGNVDLEKSKKYISTEQYKNYIHFTINKGDIVTACSGGSWGKSAIYNLNDKIILNTSTLRLRFFDDLGENQYLYYLTKTFYFKQSLSLHTTGQQPNYGYFHYSKIPIPLPPLSEQKRIVAILNEAYAAIDKAKANAEKNLQNAKELFESYLQNVFENKGDGWVNATIGKTCNLQTGGTPSTTKKEYYQGGTIKWLVSGDINKKEINDCEGRITELGMNSSNTKYLPLNSVLIALNGQGKTRGTVAMLRTKATCNQSLVSIYPKDEKKLLPELVFSNLEGRYEEIRKMTGDSGNDRRGLNMPLIRSIEFSYPNNLIEQKRIIKKLAEIKTQTKKLEAIYQRKIEDLEELKNSVLQKAFAGELMAKRQSAQLYQISNISTTDLQAGIIVMAYQKHKEKGKENTFHHVKVEKIINTIQYHIGIELNRNPVKDAAGPNDFPHAKKVESRAMKAGFFTVKNENGFYTYNLGNQSQQLADKIKSCLNEKFEEVNKLIDLMIPMNTQQAEIVATLYAAWNNLLIDGDVITNEAIVYEARENWHVDKLKIPREKFFTALDWMKKQQLIPRGVGKKVLAKRK